MIFLLLCGLLTFVVAVYCLGVGLDPGLTNLGAILWKGFLLSTISYLSLSLLSSTSGTVIDDPVGFFIDMLLSFLLSLYLSIVDLVVL